MTTEVEAPKEDEQKILDRPIADEMKESFLDYAMSVIVSRALPDVKDGLKPVHRRVLFSMHDLGLGHNKSYKKSARIVGDCMGKYHPHGDLAIYDSLVRMAQNFSLRYPLVDGQGNFGSIDGDPPAAMRYTEARMAKTAEEMLADIEKNTVNFVPNYDGHMKEPSVLPSKIPNLLVNGSTGIAVGMATNIPPHNMTEVTDAVIALIDKPGMEINELTKIVKGPDFPTAGIICGRNGIRNAYAFGRGRIIVKARTHIEEKKGKERIIVTEIPYQVNKSQMIEHIASLVKEGKVEGISDIRDESNKEGMRIVFVLKGTVGNDVVLNQLFKYSRLRTTFGSNMLALVNNEPKTLNLKQLLQYFIQHRKEVVTRRAEFELAEAKAKAHKLEGLKIALDNIDPVIKLIKEAANARIAMEGLIQNYNMTEIQAKTVLEMRLQRLTGLEQEKLRKDLAETLELITELETLLADEKLIYNIVKEETAEMREKYRDERRTEITDVEIEEDIEDESLIEEEKMIVTVTHKGYVKRMPLYTYKQQKRGGKGVRATGMRDEDFVQDLFVASTHSYLLCFTNTGIVHWLKVYRLPEGSRQARGKPIVNLLPLKKNERIAAVIPVREFLPDMNLVAVTKNGLIKKTALTAYSRPRRGGIIAITLEEKDQLVEVKLTTGDDEIMIGTANGMAARFSEKDVRSIGRSGKGVRGIRLGTEDRVIGMIVAQPGKDILTITENGYGKRTAVELYRKIFRGGKGVTNIKTSDRNGKVVMILGVTDEADIMFISKKGIIIRTRASGVSRIGRSTQGFRLMRLSAGDKVVASAKFVSEEVENNDNNGGE